MSAMFDPLLEPQPNEATRARLDSSHVPTDLGGAATPSNVPRLPAPIRVAVHDQPHSGPTAPKHAPRRRVVIGRVVLTVAVLLIPVLYSYTVARTGPGSDSAQARTV